MPSYLKLISCSQLFERITLSVYNKIYTCTNLPTIILEIAEMLPGILNQLGAESLSSLKKLASTVAGGTTH